MTARRRVTAMLATSRHGVGILMALVSSCGPTATSDARSAAIARDTLDKRISQSPPGATPIEGTDEAQPPYLPPLPTGMTLDDIRAGDAVFHAPGGCFVCHGPEGQGRPDAGSAITVGLSRVAYDWHAIDSLITHGIPATMSRTRIGMPARGAKGDLTAQQIRFVAAYVWAISQARGEPWTGGHTSHGERVPPGSTSGTARPPS